MLKHDIEEWEQEHAEVEIRRWLISQNLWAPEVLYERLAKPEAPESAIGELDHDQIDQLLRSEIVGRLGCHAEGETYVVPVAYVYDGECIYGHTVEGTKTRMLRANPEVCFEVDHIDDLMNWQSVIVWGRFEALHGEAADRAMRLLIDRLKPFMEPVIRQTSGDPRAAEMRRLDTQHRQEVVYRIKLTKQTGRFQKR